MNKGLTMIIGGFGQYDVLMTKTDLVDIIAGKVEISKTASLEALDII
jgi:hypothetical protein